jgi:CBS domain-containing protein
MPTFRNAIVRDVMRSPVTTTSPTTSLDEAVRRLYEDDLSCLVVDMNDDSLGYGIVTQKDILSVLADEGSTPDGLTVADVMTYPMVVLQPTYSIGTSMQLMRMVGVRRAAVVEGTNLVGFVSFTDIFRFAVESEGCPDPVEVEDVDRELVAEGADGEHADLRALPGCRRRTPPGG